MDEIARLAALPPDDAVLDGLVAALGADRKPAQRRAADALVVAATGGRMEAVRARLETALADASLRRRWGAAWTLARLGPPPPACLPVLVDVIGHADGDLRWAAAMVLRAMAEQPAVRPTLVALVADGNAPQRKMALYCLRDLGTGSADELAAARGALSDPEPGVRLAAIAMLAQRAPGAAAADVAACVRDADAGVRRAAAATLGTLGVRDAAVVDALTAASRSDDASLARAAAGALRRLTASTE